MVSFASDNVSAEKVNALKKFHRRRLSQFVPVIEALIAVLLLLSWLTPSISAGECFRRLISSGLKSGIFIFGLVNVLIVMIFSLSNDQKLSKSDLYLQYVPSSSAADFSSASEVTSIASISTKTELPVSASRGAAKAIEEAVPMRRDLVRAVSSMADTAYGVRRRRDEMTLLLSATTESSSQVYMRSRSERVDYRPKEKRLCEIDGLSSDEFRSTVEMFIAGKKKILLQENLKL